MLLLAIPLLAGLFLVWRMPRWPAEGSQGQVPLSIIIPARNEAGNIARLLESISIQKLQPLETVVVDDHSEDDTAAIALRHGARVISSPPLPQGWRGKTWACHNGAEESRGETLLFLDADITLLPCALGRIWKVYTREKAAALSIGPYHQVRKAYEQLSAIFNIFTYAGMGSFSVCGRPDRPRGLFGPFLMIEKTAYRQVGGHAAVKGEILENMSMAPLLAKCQARTLCLPGRGLVDIRMYPDGFRSMAEGWTKAFALGADKTSPAILFTAVFWTVGAVLAALAPAFIPFGLTVREALLIYGAYALGFHWMARRVGSFSIASSLLFPIPLIFYLLVFTRSAIIRASGKPVSWRGRTIGGES